MNKETYISRIKERIDRINLLQKQLSYEKSVLRDLKSNYVRKFCDFPPGTKVKLTYPAHSIENIFTGNDKSIHERVKYAFVEYNKVNEENMTIMPIMRICKKDGSKGEQRVHVYDAKIEKA